MRRRDPPAEARGQPAELELGTERSARQQNDASGEDLHQVACLAKDEMPWPVDGTDSDLPGIHRHIPTSIGGSAIGRFVLVAIKGRQKTAGTPEDARAAT